MSWKYARGKYVVVALAVLLMLVPLTVSASSPHFINTSAAINNDGSISVSFKEAGLGDNQLINYVLSADSSAVYYCLNGGGNHPKASNKETVNGPVLGSGQFSSGKNGAVTGSVSAGPLGPGSFSCPNGQRLVLGEVHYWNVSFSDTTNGVSADIPGTFDMVFITF